MTEFLVRSFQWAVGIGISIGLAILVDRAFCRRLR